MSQPSLKIKSVIVKFITTGSTVVRRYFFEWYDRKSLAAQVARIQFKDASGQKIGAEQVVKLPKVNQIGTVKVDDQTKPHYDSPVWFSIDIDFALPEATSFSYLTVALLKKTNPVESVISTDREDLRGL